MSAEDAQHEDDLSCLYSVGQRVIVINYTGTVRFVGKTHFASGVWIGIELDVAIGKNNGTALGVRYFECRPQHGLFVREDNVKPADLPRPLSMSSEIEDETPVHKTSTLRRYGISSETFQGGQEILQQAALREVYPKSPSERTELCDMIAKFADAKLSVMFGNLSEDMFSKVIDSMFVKTYSPGDLVCEEGDPGDHLFIVKSGAFDYFEGIDKRAGMPMPRGGNGELTPRGSRTKVLMRSGDIFGDEGLLSCVPRTFAVEAKEPSELWCLERTAFRTLIVGESEEQFSECLAFLKGCELFQGLTNDQLAMLAEVMEEEDFMPDEAIIDQGGRDDNFFIMRRGKSVACILGEQGEVEVKHYEKGDFFGEIALLEDKPRQASIYSVGPSTCLYISRNTFIRILGPLQEFLLRNMEKYTKYHDAIHASAKFSTRRLSLELRQGHQAVEDVEVFDGGLSKRHRANTRVRDRSINPDGSQMQPGQAAAQVANTDDDDEEDGPPMARINTMYVAPSKVLEEDDEDEEKPEAKDDAPRSLQEKMQMDFRNPSLVNPCDGFVIPEACFHMFGGIQLGQKFMSDKQVVARTRSTPASDGVEDTYSWSGPSWQAGSTHIAVLCQKGQKSASDPTPNQDNYFVLNIANAQIYGVFDGHGPFGHLVSMRLAQSVPSLLWANQNRGTDWKQALKEAFIAAQQELLSFAREHKVNLEASGAAGSVLVMDGPKIHISHIGDACVMLASWNRHDSHLVANTVDHKPQLPAERERLEAAGSEVREVDEGSFRIYRRGTNFPGLTMSRAFGDTACEGVLQEPDYQEHSLQPNDEFYAIVASDGIWEFLDFEKVVDLTNKKLRVKGPREMVKHLTEASRKRWALCCGDYCDDITAIAVQWNVKKKDANINYVVQVARPD